MRNNWIIRSKRNKPLNFTFLRKHFTFNFCVAHLIVVFSPQAKNVFSRLSLCQCSFAAKQIHSGYYALTAALYESSENIFNCNRQCTLYITNLFYGSIHKKNTEYKYPIAHFSWKIQTSCKMSNWHPKMLTFFISQNIFQKPWFFIQTNDIWLKTFIVHIVQNSSLSLSLSIFIIKMTFYLS